MLLPVVVLLLVGNIVASDRHPQRRSRRPGILLRAHLNIAHLRLERPGEIPRKEHNNNKHEQRVKDVERPLVLQQVPIIAHGVLNDAEDGTDHDECADSVEHLEHDAPVVAVGAGRARVVPVDAQVEDGRDDDEEAEDDDLHEEAAEDDALGELLLALHDHHAGAGGLDHEGDDVARDEEEGEALGADEGVGFAVDAADDAAEDHVDGGGEEGWGDEDEDALDDVGDELVGFVSGGYSGSVADCLDCWWGGLDRGPLNGQERRDDLQMEPMMKTEQYHVRALIVRHVTAAVPAANKIVKMTAAAVLGR